MPENVRSAVLTEMKRIASDACELTKLSETPCLISFAGFVETNSSLQFVLLQMSYFVSASFGKFLTPNVPITCEFDDRTRAIVSTACTAWLSSAGAAAGLPTSGISISPVSRFQTVLIWYVPTNF